MHAGDGVAAVDDRSLGGGEGTKPVADGVLWHEVIGQANVGRVVAGLRLEEAAVEGRQFLVGHMVGER